MASAHGSAQPHNSVERDVEGAQGYAPACVGAAIGIDVPNGKSVVCPLCKTRQKRDRNVDLATWLCEHYVKEHEIDEARLQGTSIMQAATQHYIEVNGTGMGDTEAAHVAPGEDETSILCLVCNQMISKRSAERHFVAQHHLDPKLVSEWVVAQEALMIRRGRLRIPLVTACHAELGRGLAQAPDPPLGANDAPADPVIPRASATAAVGPVRTDHANADPQAPACAGQVAAAPEGARVVLKVLDTQWASDVANGVKFWECSANRKRWCNVFKGLGAGDLFIVVTKHFLKVAAVAVVASSPQIKVTDRGVLRSALPPERHASLDEYLWQAHSFDVVHFAKVYTPDFKPLTVHQLLALIRAPVPSQWQGVVRVGASGEAHARLGEVVEHWKCRSSAEAPHQSA